MLKKILKNRLSDKKREKLSNAKYFIANFICDFFPMNDEIILESYPDLTCNTYELYRYMIKMKLNEKVKIVWLVDNKNDYKNFKTNNVFFMNINPNNLIERVQNYYKCNRAIVLITSNRHYGRQKTSKKQVNIYLDHGSHLKKLSDKTGRKIISCDYLICQSSFFMPYHLSQYVIEKEKIIITGLPRNDQLFFKNNSLYKLYKDRSLFEKIILWVPTFRSHMNGNRIDCVSDFPLGIPILYSIDDTTQVNKCLIENNTLLIIKPHPSQNLDIIKDLNYSNIRFLYNTDLINESIQLNELLEQMDGMITDYSSIYYDFLLLDRPIGITLDDYEKYKEQKGFVFEQPLEILKGEYIYNCKDLLSFITNLKNNIDKSYEERKLIKYKINDFIDNNSSKRVYDFMISKIDKE